MQPVIRPFTPDDYEAVVAIGNAVFPEYPGTVEEARFHDANRDPKCKNFRWVAEVDGQVVGSANLNQSPMMYHPRKFWMDVEVHPEHQRQGVGATLYEMIAAELAQHDPLAVWAGCREDMVASQRFLERRGFKEAWRRWESRLDVAAFDPAPYAELERAVTESGLQIKTFAELEGDPERDRKLYELECELFYDVPSPQQRTMPDFEAHRRWRDENPGFLPEAYFVVVDGAEYVALTNFFANPAAGDVIIGLTGVRRSHRQRGLASVLKLRGIAYAKEHGYPSIKTWNDSVNEAMLAINVKMGFVRQPAWLNLVKVITEEAE
jgi:GNAT superfamily N-acetyltransferase